MASFLAWCLHSLPIRFQTPTAAPLYVYTPCGRLSDFLKKQSWPAAVSAADPLSSCPTWSEAKPSLWPRSQHGHLSLFLYHCPWRDSSERWLELRSFFFFSLPFSPSLPRECSSKVRAVLGAQYFREMHTGKHFPAHF